MFPLSIPVLVVVLGFGVFEKFAAVPNLWLFNLEFIKGDVARDSLCENNRPNVFPIGVTNPPV